MNRPRYSMSFTTGALLYRESLVIVELYAQLVDWKAVRDQVLAGNLLQMRTANAAERTYREVVSRLKLLTDDQRTLLVQTARPATSATCCGWPCASATVLSMTSPSM